MKFVIQFGGSKLFIKRNNITYMLSLNHSIDRKNYIDIVQYNSDIMNELITNTIDPLKIPPYKKYNKNIIGYNDQGCLYDCVYRNNLDECGCYNHYYIYDFYDYYITYNHYTFISVYLKISEPHPFWNYTPIYLCNYILYSTPLPISYKNILAHITHNTTTIYDMNEYQYSQSINISCNDIFIEIDGKNYQICKLTNDNAPKFYTDAKNKIITLLLCLKNYKIKIPKYILFSIKL